MGKTDDVTIIPDRKAFNENKNERPWMAEASQGRLYLTDLSHDRPNGAVFTS